MIEGLDRLTSMVARPIVAQWRFWVTWRVHWQRLLSNRDFPSGMDA